MHAIILANHPGTFPPCLLPDSGKSVINYCIDELLLQKQVTTITVVINPSTQSLIVKHLAASYPHGAFAFTEQVPVENDVYLLLDGTVHTSLRLQDLIRYYQQFKTITYAAFDKTNPKLIPFTIYPPVEKRDMQATHTYNAGTGFCHFLYVPVS